MTESANCVVYPRFVSLHIQDPKAPWHKLASETSGYTRAHQDLVGLYTPLHQVRHTPTHHNGLRPYQTY